MSIGVSMVLLIYLMGYLGLRQPQIFEAEKAVVGHVDQSETVIELVNQTEPNVDTSKYKNSPLTQDLSLAILDEIKQTMAVEKPYLDSQISLPELADKLGISVHYLSQTINEQLNQNFFDFINSYRIEEAKRRLASPECQKQSVLTIAMDAGFNSKSSFYNAFKKHMLMTPTQYRNSLKESA